MRKFLARLIIMTAALAILGFVAFAYVGDLSPARTEIAQTISLDLK